MCDTVTVLLGDIVLLAFEKILDLLFLGTEKLHFYNCTNFCLQLHKFFYNCTICAQLHTKKNPGPISLKFEKEKKSKTVRLSVGYIRYIKQ